MKVNRPESQRTSKTLLILIMLSIAALIVFVFISKGSFTEIFSKNKNANLKLLAKIKVPENIISEYVTYKDKILQITNSGIDILDSSGKNLYKIDTPLQNPIVKTSDKYIFVGDNGSKTVYCYEESKMLWKRVLDGNIDNIRVNKNGYIIILKQAGPNGEIIGFNNKGTELIRKTYQNYLYLINADISDDNKKAVAVCSYTEKSRIASRIEIFELKSTSQVNSVPTAVVLKDDTIVTDTKVFDNGNIILMTDNKIIGLDAAGKDKWEKPFGSKIYNTNILSGNYAIIESNGTLKSSLLENKSRFLDIFDQDGVTQGVQIKLEPIKNIDVFKNYFLANTSSKIYCISKGKVLWSYSPGKDIKYIKGFSEKSQVLIASKDTIEILEIN